MRTAIWITAAVITIGGLLAVDSLGQNRGNRRGQGQVQRQQVGPKAGCSDSAGGCGLTATAGRRGGGGGCGQTATARRGGGGLADRKNNDRCGDVVGRQQLGGPRGEDGCNDLLATLQDLKRRMVEWLAYLVIKHGFFHIRAFLGQPFREFAARMNTSTIQNARPQRLRVGQEGLDIFA